MSALSVLNDILDVTVSQTQALNFIIPGSGPVTVVKRKLPKKEETVDPAWQIIVCEDDDPEDVEWFAFPDDDEPRGTVKVRYKVIVTIISPNNDDQLTNLDVYADWRQTIRRRFNAPDAYSAVTQVFDARARMGVFLDRGEINENYDYQQVEVVVSTYEPGRP